jgi:transmembrane sensor
MTASNDSVDPAPYPSDKDAGFTRAVMAAARGPVVVTGAETEAAWQALATRVAPMAASGPAPALAEAKVVPITAAASARRTIPWRRLTSLAAAALVVVSAGVSWQHRRSAFNEVTAPAGQRVAVQLPDGSHLTLAAGSHARWRKDYGDRSRDVYLTGEAVLEVVHDTTRAFRVYTGNAVVEDIGTRFLVRAWPEQSGVDVVVTEGIVALADTTTAQRTAALRRPTIVAGQRGVLRADGTVQVTPADTSALAWMSGALHFDNTPLREALPVLSRWYAVTIDADATLMDRRLTGHFMQQSLPQLLDALGLALDVRVRRDTNGVLLQP